LFTSDDERLKAKERVQVIMLDFERDQLKHVESIEAELSARHAMDMRSDSWLSKNIRPMALIFLTVSMVLLAYVTTFDETLTVTQVEVLKTWSGVISSLLMLVYGFYFGSRGLEKVMKICGDKGSKG
jgi:hypothetical protein